MCYKTNPVLNDTYKQNKSALLATKVIHNAELL